MRMIATWLVAAVLLTAGCTPASAPPATGAPVVTTPSSGGAVATAPSDLGVVAIDKVAVPAAQGLVIGELAYNSTAETVKLLVAKGLIRGETATRVRDLNAKAMTALDFAYNASNQVERARQVAKLYDAIGGLDAIAKPLKGLIGKVN
jgi:hypothetical protein